MSIASEAAGSPNQLQTSLQQGLGSLSRNQKLVFTQYTKQTISEDGYVFWVAGSATITAKGSLHYSTDRSQEEDQTIGINAVEFTSEVEITELNGVNMGTLWICPWLTPDGNTIQIAFSSRGAYYDQAGLFHYTGFAVFPALQSQLIATLADLPAGPIVSNSLPIWLDAAANMGAIVGSQAPTVPAYASFLIPENIVPPYVVVHIEPEMTKAIQGFPRYSWSQKTGTGPYQLPGSQLMQDMVRLTLYGFTNQQAQQWLSGLIIYSLATENFGFMNSPAIQDEKRLQSEIAAVAMKKTITIHADYNQGAADMIVRQLILSASVSFQTS
ncbi:MAG: hypothetical protein ACYCY2_05635 [Acidithiobacillus ferriphilus]